MATYTGKEGIVKIGAHAVAEVTDFTVKTSAETVDDTVKGDDWRTKKATYKAWTADVSCMWDDDDANGQALLVEGAEVSFIFYPGGDDTNKHQLAGNAIVTERSVESPLEGMLGLSISAEGNGALTESTVTE